MAGKMLCEGGYRGAEKAGAKGEGRTDRFEGVTVFRRAGHELH